MGSPDDLPQITEQQLIRNRRLLLHAASHRTVLPSFLAAGAAMTALASSSFSLLPVLAWVLGISIAYSLRIYHMRWYEKNEKKVTDYRNHRIWFNLAFLTTGLCWAFAVVYFGHELPANIRDIVYILAGITSAFSVVTAAASLSFFLAFNIPIAAAVLYCFSMHAGTSNLALIEIIIFYLVALFLSNHLRNIFIHRIKLELKNENLSASQNASRAELENIKKVFRSIPDAVVITHFHDGKFIAVNDSTCTMTGYERTDFSRRTIFDMGFWHDPAEQEHFVSELKEHKLIRDFQARFVIKSGEIRDCELSAEIAEIDGTPCVICAIRDNTERHQAERALQESEVRFGTIFDSAPNGIAIGNTNGQFLKVNKKFCELLGYSEAELLGKHLGDMSVDENQAGNTELLKGLSEGAIRGYQMEKQYIHKSGKHVWIHLSASRIEDENGDLKFIVMHASDVGSRKKAEFEIIQSASKFKAVFDEAPISMTLLDESGTIIEVNKASCDMSGYSREELLAMSFMDVTHPDYLESSKELHGNLMRGEINSYRAERQLITKSGSPKWVDLNVAVVTDADGKPAYRIAHVQDIDVSKKQELKLLDQQDIYVQAEHSGKLGYWEWDEVEDRMIRCSEGYASIFGLSREEYLHECRSYDSSLAAIHPDDRDMVRQMDRQAVSTGQALELEFRIITSDSDLKYVLERSNMVTDDNNRVIRSFGITQDITQRKLAEIELEKRQLMLERSESLGGVGHWEWDEVEEKLIYCSQQYAEILGLSVEETLARSSSEEADLTDVHPDDVDYVRQAEADSYANATPFDMEYRIITSSGDVRYVHQLGDSEKNSEGVVIRSFGTLQDITEKKLAELERVKRETMFERAEVIGRIGHWEWDEVDDFLISCSEEYANIFGMDRQKLMQVASSYDGDLSLVHEDDLELRRNLDFKSRAESIPIELEYRIVRPDGEVRHVHQKGDVELDAQGNLVRSYGTLQDITERKLTELKLKEQQRRSREAEKLGRLGHWEWDEMQDTLVYASDEFARIHEKTVEECLSQSNSFVDDLETIHPDDQKKYTDFYDEVASKNDLSEIQYRLITAKGNLRHVKEITRTIFDDKGNVIRYVGTTQDITEQVNTENKLRTSQVQFKHTFNNAPIGMALVELDGTITELNHAASKMLGYSREESIGMSMSQLTHADEHEQSKERLKKLSSGEIDNYNIIRRFRHHSGEFIWVDLHCNLIRQTDGTPLYLIIQGVDITEQRNLSDKLSYQASHDSLTDLINRREFEARLNKMIESAHSRAAVHTFCYMDLDQFKLVNDTFGHAAGDELLRQLCGLIQSGIRSRDTLARLGGDEFGLLMEHCQTEDALLTAENLRNSINDFRFVWNDTVLSVGVSMGIVVIDHNAGTSDDLLKAADNACYLAKEQGRNRIKVYAESDEETTVRQSEMKWATRINHAISNDELFLVAQPIAALKEQGSGGGFYELLLRIHDSRGELVSRFCPAYRSRAIWSDHQYR